MDETALWKSADNANDVINPAVNNLYGQVQMLNFEEDPGHSSCDADEAVNDVSRVTDDMTDDLMTSDVNVATSNEIDDDKSKDGIRQEMLNRVSRSNGYFKHQQLSEPDLTVSEKRSIATNLLDERPSTFLERYGKFLAKSDLAYFERFRGDYATDFHLEQVEKRLAKANAESTRVKNRRYEAMRRLVARGEYFSDDEMKKRDPMLYGEMVGRYLDEDEIAKEVNGTDMSLSNVLLKHLQAVQNNELFAKQQEVQECSMQEVEYESETEEDDDVCSKEDDGPTENEKIMLRNEFIETMEQRFMDGQDVDFDYCDVDNNEEYDSLDIVNRDEEDRYFASEDDYNDDDNNDYKNDIDFNEDNDKDFEETNDML